MFQTTNQWSNRNTDVGQNWQRTQTNKAREIFRGLLAKSLLFSSWEKNWNLCFSLFLKFELQCTLWSKKHFLLIQTPHHPVVLVSIQNMMHYDCSLNLHLWLLSTYFSPFLMAPWKFACLTCTFWWVHFGKHPHSCWSNLYFLVSNINSWQIPNNNWAKSNFFDEFCWWNPFFFCDLGWVERSNHHGNRSSMIFRVPGALRGDKAKELGLSQVDSAM